MRHECSANWMQWIYKHNNNQGKNSTCAASAASHCSLRSLAFSWRRRSSAASFSLCFFLWLICLNSATHSANNCSLKICFQSKCQIDAAFGELLQIQEQTITCLEAIWSDCWSEEEKTMSSGGWMWCWVPLPNCWDPWGVLPADPRVFTAPCLCELSPKLKPPPWSSCFCWTCWKCCNGAGIGESESCPTDVCSWRKGNSMADSLCWSPKWVGSSFLFLLSRSHCGQYWWPGSVLCVHKAWRHTPGVTVILSCRKAMLKSAPDTYQLFTTLHIVHKTVCYTVLISHCAVSHVNLQLVWGQFCYRLCSFL